MPTATDDVRALLDKHLKHLLERGVDPASFGREARLREDLGFTSLESVSLLMSVEEDLDIEISDEELAGLRTLGELVDLLTAKRQAKLPA
jgi:acyl carrier protein